MADQLRVVILKPSKYRADGYVERFRWGFMPNSTVPYMRSMTPAGLGGTQVEVHTIDEYVHTDQGYLSLLKRPRIGQTLLALVGVQSHQFHRALDLAALARRNGCLAVIGGPHVMTCDTSMLHGRGVTFALAEAELIWREILEDAVGGQLRSVYGTDGRWQQELEAPVVVPPDRQDLRRYVIPMLGLYPARGCPFTCIFCSVIKIAGRRIRSQNVATTLASLRAAKAGGVRTIMFTSDNFPVVEPRGAQLDALGLAQKWCACGVSGDHGHVAVQSVFHVEADPPHVRRCHARAAGPRGRVPPAAQGSVPLRAGTATAQPATGGGGQLAEPGRRSACAGELTA